MRPPVESICGPARMDDNAKCRPRSEIAPKTFERALALRSAMTQARYAVAVIATYTHGEWISMMSTLLAGAAILVPQKRGASLQQTSLCFLER